jgi:hypothetical protein
MAAASYWLIGGSSSSNSIVRSNELVYNVLSTIPRFTYGTHQQSDGAARVHVMRSVLRIVFHDETSLCSARTCCA